MVNLEMLGGSEVRLAVRLESRSVGQTHCLRVSNWNKSKCLALFLIASD